MSGTSYRRLIDVETTLHVHWVKIKGSKRSIFKKDEENILKLDILKWLRLQKQTKQISVVHNFY